MWILKGGYILLGTRTAGVEDLDGVEFGLLGDAVSAGADSSCHMGTVAVAIGVVIISVVGQEGGTPPEFLEMGGQLVYPAVNLFG